MDLIPVMVFVASAILLLIASAMPVKMRPIKNLLEYREMARRKGLSLQDIDQYVHPLIIQDKNFQISVQVVLSTLILVASLLIMLSHSFNVHEKHWAYGSAGIVLGFWLS